MSWEQAAHHCKKTYGVFVDWDEDFFICPECGEPIYKDDWDELHYCPVCEFEW